MTIANVIRDVCLVVGVAEPTGSVFPASPAERTKAEFIALANEMAQRIAFNTGDWTALRAFALITSDGIKDEYPLPVDYRRLLKTSNLYRGASKQSPMRFVSDADDWLRGGTSVSGLGEWMLRGRNIKIRPVSVFGTAYEFPYLTNTCVNSAAGVPQTAFLSGDDSFALDERLLKLGMIWQWKALKGGSYIEDMQNYEDALAYAAASDKPSPIIIGTAPISHAARTAYPYPLSGVP